MCTNLSPSVSRELTNLGKDTDTGKSVMTALKSHVKDLDSKAIPLFIARVSETKDVGTSSSGEYSIPLYEELARVHGPSIVSQIDIIMGSITRILTTSGGSFPLQQACSKVAPTIARYAIVPTTAEDEKKRIIRMLSKPLSDSILSSKESLSCGAALCLNALVECDNWRFASDEIVNEVCLKIAGALKDEVTQTASHMGLVMSLAKHNSLVVEAYAGLLIRSGLEILNAGATEGNPQKSLQSIQMISFLMKCLDIKSIYSELDLIIEEMEKCQSDEIAYVRGASHESLQIARDLINANGPKFDPDMVSVTGSNGRSGQGYKLASGDQSPASSSSDSQSLDSFVDNGMLVNSPFSLTQASCNGNHSRKNASRQLSSYENGGVDISLKDGIFSEIVRGGASHALSDCCKASDPERGYYYNNGFRGFYPGTPSREGFRSQTPSPQRARPQKSATGSGKMYVWQCEQESVEFQEENQGRRLTSPCSVKRGGSNTNSIGKRGAAVHIINGDVVVGQHSENESESSSVVSSTEDVGAAAAAAAAAAVKEQNLDVTQGGPKTLLCSSILLLLLAIIVAVFLFGDNQDQLLLVPT